MTNRGSLAEPWVGVSARFRERGLRWTPQRRAVVDVLASSAGHVTSAELIDRCRELDAGTIPSTVYRTLDVLEELGLVRHGHGADGREEFHVSPAGDHGHLYCDACGGRWEIDAKQAPAVVRAFRDMDGFDVDLSHVTFVGLCSTCALAGEAAPA
jgi:Fur family transcriptional regulator, ferric uptake regulator